MSNSYSPAEERLNIWTHGIGVLLSVFVLIVFIRQALPLDVPYYLFSVCVFGGSLILLYSASTLYHSATHPTKRYRLKVFDHAAIYVLIAGTYTPFALVTLQESSGWTLFIAVWTFALGGILLKIFFTGRFKLLSTLIYVAMGWLVVMDLNGLFAYLSDWGQYWLFLGGMFYMVGAVVYMVKRIPFNHAIFHVFVLFGSAAHVIAVYYHV